MSPRSETWSKYEYDRSPSNDYDPEYARRQWEDEEMEEKERQLDDRCVSVILCNFAPSSTIDSE